MLTFATLGPTGSNHELVARRYIDAHRLAPSRVVLVERFDEALRLLSTDEVDFIVQVAVHPDAAEIVASAHFQFGIHVIDTFISPSRPLAVLTRREVAEPKTLGLQPATKLYTDTTRWQTLVPEVSIATVGEGLLAGRFDSGITAIDLADQHPERLRIDEELGSVDDPWMVFGRERLSDDGVTLWPDSPAAHHYRRALSR